MRLKTPIVRNGLNYFIDRILPETPLLVVSAGISDVIRETLTIHGIDTSHCSLYIISNDLEFDIDGKISSILPEVPIHSKSKHLTPKLIPHVFFSNNSNTVRVQKYLRWDAVVLLGDRPGDFNYLKEHLEVVKLKIGFCRTYSDAKQLVAESGCHAVLVGEDHSFEPVNHLLHVLKNALQQGRQQIPQNETPTTTHDSFYFFQSENVFLNENFFSNITSFLDRLASKPCDLLFISDFDHTITTFSSEQCHDLIGNVSEYSEEFRSKYQEFMVEYGPSNVYGEFHTLCHDLVTKESGLTREMFHESLTASNIPQVRPGLKQFIELLNELSLPLLISSAGIKDIIESTLQMQDIDVSHCESLVSIDANYLQFDSSGKLTAILPLDPIHSQSKHLAPERLDEFFYAPLIAPPSAPIIPDGSFGTNLQSTAESHNASTSKLEGRGVQWGVALLLGDSPGDFTVLQDHPEVLTMKVGFARDEAAAAVLMEQASCHVVLVGISHSWEPVNRLLDVFLDAQGRGGH